jgi:hypothetical protein
VRLDDDQLGAIGTLRGVSVGSPIDLRAGGRLTLLRARHEAIADSAAMPFKKVSSTFCRVRLVRACHRHPDTSLPSCGTTTRSLVSNPSHKRGVAPRASGRPSRKAQEGEYWDRIRPASNAAPRDALAAECRRAMRMGSGVAARRATARRLSRRARGDGNRRARAETHPSYGLSASVEGRALLRVAQRPARSALLPRRGAGACPAS